MGEVNARAREWKRCLSTTEKQHLHRKLWGLSLGIRSSASTVPPELKDRASKQLNTSQGAYDSPLSTLLSLAATSLLHSLQRSPLAAIGSRYSCSAVHNHIVSAYVSHMSFLRVLQSDWRHPKVGSRTKPEYQFNQTLFLMRCCAIEGKGLARQTNLYLYQ